LSTLGYPLPERLSATILSPNLLTLGLLCTVSDLSTPFCTLSVVFFNFIGCVGFLKSYKYPVPALPAPFALFTLIPILSLVFGMAFISPSDSFFT
jgi:hypothetical protein